MQVANATRGETSITLQGQSYVMRPSWEAIEEFETATGKSVKELFDAAAGDRMRLGDLAAVVGACVRAYGRATRDADVQQFKDKRIKELIPGEDGGILVVTRAVALVLMMAVTGGVTSTGEVKAPPTKSPSTEAGEGSPE